MTPDVKRKRDLIYDTVRVTGPYGQGSAAYKEFVQYVLGRKGTLGFICQGNFEEYVQNDLMDKLSQQSKKRIQFGVYIASAHVSSHECDQPVGFLFFREIETEHMSKATLYIHIELICNGKRHASIDGPGGMQIAREMEKFVTTHKLSGAGVGGRKSIDTIQFSLDALDDELADAYQSKLNYFRIQRSNGDPFVNPYIGVTLIPMVKRYSLNNKNEFIPEQPPANVYVIAKRMTLDEQKKSMYKVK
jgi:hypothetical protein